MMLANLKAYDRFKVLAIHTGRETGRRLADMGFTKNSEGTIMRCGFFRGPLHVCVGGYHILVRHSEAALVEVELLETAQRQGRRGFGGGRGKGGQGKGACHGCESDATERQACDDEGNNQ